MEFDFWSNDNFVDVSNQRFNATDKKITLYNLENGCYDIVYNNKLFKKCFSNNQSSNMSFVTYLGVEKQDSLGFFDCSSVKKFYHERKCFDSKCFVDDIVSVFIANQIGFIQTTNTLYSCNKAFTDCDMLISPISGDVLCRNSSGLVYNQNSMPILYKLK